MNDYILLFSKVNIGIIHANPSSTEGVFKIMEHLQKYVPIRPDGTFHTIPVHGDALSIERMVDCTRARATNVKRFERFEGLQGIPQEFHHRGLMLQV